MKPMLPSLTFEMPEGQDFLHEVKYDGFRGILTWNSKGISLISRNGKDLLHAFPEISRFLLENEKLMKPFLPLQFDGEVVILENPYKADFSSIQVRGRMRSEKKIEEISKIKPCRFMVFDALILSGIPLINDPFHTRKSKLSECFKTMKFQLEADETSPQVVQFIRANKDLSELWKNIVLYDGEGIVSKKKNSLWEEGKRSTQWLKYKNWKLVACFITAYEKSNGYFHIAVFKDTQTFPIGSVLFGFKPEEKASLLKIAKENNISEDKQFIYLKPAICLQVKYLELYDSQLREPHFDHFLFNTTPAECTYKHFQSGLKNLPPELLITHPDKPLWDKKDISKIDFIDYLREVSSYMLPFLKNRILTVIRFPHGMFGEAFYQKNCPDYAPGFVKTHNIDGINFIVCNNLETMIWLGNQIAIEFHIPFQTISSTGPSEIVFDLDPPSPEAFHLAARAAIYIKEVLDELQLISFIKTSGNKGLQIYIPLPENTYTYDDTRLFTTFIAEYLVTKEPDSFTIERLKKNRGKRLYVDYVQHAEGKTIIAPFSARGNDFAGIATPLYWDEVPEILGIADFNFKNALKRLKTQGNPFKDYFAVKNDQPFGPVLQFLKR
jgi:bifunctional non-homologous end joining protein LigD